MRRAVVVAGLLAACWMGVAEADVLGRAKETGCSGWATGRMRCRSRSTTPRACPPAIRSVCASVAEAARGATGRADLQVAWRQLGAEDRFDALARGEADLLCSADRVTLGRRERRTSRSLPSSPAPPCSTAPTGPAPSRPGRAEGGRRAGTTTEAELRGGLAGRGSRPRSCRCRATRRASSAWPRRVRGLFRRRRHPALPAAAEPVPRPAAPIGRSDRALRAGPAQGRRRVPAGGRPHAVPALPVARDRARVHRRVRRRGQAERAPASALHPGSPAGLMPTIATWNVNSVNARLPNVLAWLARGQARHRAAAGDQVPGRGVPARGHRRAGLQCRDPRPEELQRRRDPEPAPDRGPGAGPARRSRGRAGPLPRGHAWVAGGLDLPAQRQPDRHRQVRLQAALDGAAARRTRRRCWSRTSRSSWAATTTSSPSRSTATTRQAWLGDALFQPESRRAFRSLLHSALTEAFRALHPDERGAYTLLGLPAAAPSSSTTASASTTAALAAGRRPAGRLRHRQGPARGAQGVGPHAVVVVTLEKLP